MSPDILSSISAVTPDHMSAATALFTFLKAWYWYSKIEYE